MTKNYEYMWLFPAFSVFFMILALITPTAYFDIMGVSWTWWMWNMTFMSASGLGSEFVFIPEIDFIIPSLITTCVMIFIFIFLIALTLNTRKKKLDTRGFELTSIIIGILIIVITVYYLVALDFAFYDGLVIEGTLFPAGYHYWEVFTPSFGVVGPFLTAIVLFIGSGAFRYYSKRVDLILSTVETTPKIESKIKLAGGINFCPECGQKRISSTHHFCTKCGFEFQDVG
ncbi:MAG: zinc ribbon domain-containing protein [Promethearchaeota archaeon]